MFNDTLQYVVTSGDVTQVLEAPPHPDVVMEQEVAPVLVHEALREQEPAASA